MSNSYLQHPLHNRSTRQSKHDQEQLPIARESRTMQGNTHMIKSTIGRESTPSDAGQQTHDQDHNCTCEERHTNAGQQTHDQDHNCTCEERKTDGQITIAHVKSRSQLHAYLSRAVLADTTAQQLSASAFLSTRRHVNNRKH